MARSTAARSASADVPAAVPPQGAENRPPAPGPDFSALTAPFPEDAIEWRLARAGTTGDGQVWAVAFAYLTARAIQQRLDEAAGPANWRNEYRPAPNAAGRGVLCGLSLRIGGEWITKWDGADNSEMEPVKGGLSEALKRAATQWGIGRYLYDLPDQFCQTSISRQSGNQWYYAAAKTDRHPAFWWKPPALPAWALPASSPPSRPAPDAGLPGRPLSPAGRPDAAPAEPLSSRAMKQLQEIDLAQPGAGGRLQKAGAWLREQLQIGQLSPEDHNRLSRELVRMECQLALHIDRNDPQARKKLAQAEEFIVGKHRAGLIDKLVYQEFCQIVAETTWDIDAAQGPAQPPDAPAAAGTANNRQGAPS